MAKKRELGLRAENGALGTGSRKSSSFLGTMIDGGIYNGDWRRFSFRPEKVPDVQKLCRAYEESLFLRTGLLLLKSFANWGCRIQAQEPADRETIKKWLKQDDGQSEADLMDYIGEVWRDWFLMDTAVSFWRSTPDGSLKRKLRTAAPRRQRAFTLQPEDCTYTDDFGLETLKVRLILSPEALTRLSPDEKQRYASGRDVELDEAEGEYFRVLKRERVGKGFGMPRLRGLFDTLKANESLEVMDNLWGFAGRLAIRQTKLGYEVKSGPRAGLPINHYKEKVAQNLKKFLEGRMGFADWIGNFDQEFTYPFPSLDRFDKKKFDGVFQRMAMWLGPVGLLLFGQRGTPEDVLMRMLRAQMREERLKVGRHLNYVINNGFAPPAPIMVRWNDKIFMDSRQVMEMIKYLLQQGAMSQRSGLESVGEDQQEQWEEKDDEAAQLNSEENKHRVLPVFDPAHGGESPMKGGGRPAGQRSKPTG